MPSPKISAEYKFAGASLVGFRVKFLSPRFGAVLEHLDSARIVFAAILPASLIPVLAEPRLIIRALENLRAMKTFMSADAVNTTTGPQLPKYISAAFGSLDKPWKPGYSARPTEPSAATSSNQKPDRRHLPGPDPRP